MGPTVTWHWGVETIAGESDGADCYLALFSNRSIQYVVAVMVYCPILAELIFARYLNGDLHRTGGVVVTMLDFRTSTHTTSRGGERGIDIRHRLMWLNRGG